MIGDPSFVRVTVVYVMLSAACGVEASPINRRPFASLRVTGPLEETLLRLWRIRVTGVYVMLSGAFGVEASPIYRGPFLRQGDGYCKGDSSPPVADQSDG